MSEKLLELTAEIVSAYVKNNRIPMGDLGGVVSDVSAALTRLTEPAEPEVEKPVPAVNPKRSVFPDHIICLDDGKKFKSLKRHLMTAYGMTPNEYREKWDLAPDYPMVAPNYAAQRSALAKKIGLGRINPPEQKPTKKRPRTKKSPTA
ncbi:MAG: MucR family transcriptional regulator [Rhizobiaceae bacterium]|nr:MucR family transcriptional regulator [Rhizobiaceae bacterium]